MNRASFPKGIVCCLQMHQSRAFDADHPIGEEAETFARQLYESWYSQRTAYNECPNAGVLIFLSEQDHLIYVARGSALAHIITDERIERLTRQIQPLLNQKRYVRAISDMLEGINFYILYGEPHGCCVRGWFLLGMGACLAVQVALCGLIRMTCNQRLPLRRASSERMSEEERDRAETLKLRFQADSCPICLGSFQHRRDDASDNSSLVGSEGQPLILLRCGHLFDATCWMAWETACFRSDSVVKCLLCRRTVDDSDSVEYAENPLGSVY
jgi:TPM domain